MPAPTSRHPRPDVGPRIRRAREAAGLTTTELGAAIGLSAESIKAWEGGWRGPSLAAICAAARALDVPVGQLLEDEPAA